MPTHKIRWYQENPELVDSWEFQHSQGDQSPWENSGVLGGVSQCPNCFEVFVDIPVTATQVRSRSIGPGGFSSWSEPIALPETDILLSMIAGILFIAFAFGRTKWRKWF